MNLARHVRDRDWDALEEAWTAHVLEGGGPGPALDALRAAADAKEIPRCLPFVREHAEFLLGAARPADAARLLGTAMLSGGSPGELAKPLFHAAESAWGEEESWETFQTISGLAENAPDMRSAWRAFEKLLALETGRVVYHAKGWGLGRIEAIDPRAGEVKVRFQSGRQDRFPFATAVDIFEILDEGDLRALVVLDPDELQRRLKKEPLEVLRWVLERQGGRATHAAIKLALGTLGQEGPRFGAWWRRARKAAETSAWFEVSGPSTRAQVRLLDEAADPAEGLRRQLALASDLGEALNRVRSLTQGGDLSDDVAAAAYETLAELAADDAAPLERRLAVWLFLRERAGETPEVLRAMLAEAAARPDPADRSEVPALWEIFLTVPGLREQERCVELLRETIGEERFRAETVRHLPHAAPGMVRSLIDELEKAGHHDELVAHYASLLARPMRHPVVLVELAGHLEPGPFAERAPGKLQRAQCLLQLAVQLHRQPPSDVGMARARTRLSDVLTSGDPPLLRELLADAGRDDLRGFATLLESGVDRDVDRLFTRLAIQISPTVFRGEERPFWDSSAIWTTRAGLARRDAELRELKDVKIPENSEAIGRAASYGDLSENSEWEAAIEEQRNLTNRAMELEAELREAQLIENAAIPHDVCAPGTKVRFRQDGEEKSIRILGPWDAELGDDVVSYRSPLAAGMLGKSPGTRTRITLPSGETEVEILAVEPLPL